MSFTSSIDVAAIRAQLPATQTVAYLNTGTTGPLPTKTHEVMAEAATAELENGRIGMEGYLQFREHAASLRGSLGAALGADQNEIALTRSTTEGMNIAISGLDWRAGDKVVTTNIEHGGALIPLYQLHRRLGADIEFVDVANGDADQAVAAMAAAIRPGVKLVVLSHVAYGTGATLPIREITELAHAAGALVLIDGAQSVGAMPIDFHALGIDFYAFSGQKWLCGPEGTGGLFVSARNFDRLQPTYVGFGAVNHDRYRPNDVDSFELSLGAASYEAGTFYRPAIRGLATSLSWISEQTGFDEAYGRIRGLREYCVEQLSHVADVELMAPAEALAGLVAFRWPGLDPVASVQHLRDGGVSIRSIPENNALRLSCGFYNTTDEIDLAIGLARELQ
jgi:L-cysteine/cystine lyase